MLSYELQWPSVGIVKLLSHVVDVVFCVTMKLGGIALNELNHMPPSECGQLGLRELRSFPIYHRTFGSSPGFGMLSGHHHEVQD